MRISLEQNHSFLESDIETPISLFMRRHGEDPAILLESAEIDGRWGRHSVIAGDFLLILRCLQGKLALDIHDARLTPLRDLEGMPFVQGLRAVMQALEVLPPSLPPGNGLESEFPPITRALYGYLGYGLAGLLEPEAGGFLPPEKAEACLALPGSLTLFDHAYNRVHHFSLIQNPVPFPKKTERNPGLRPMETAGEVQCCMEKDACLKMIRAVQERARQGEIIHAAPSVQFNASFQGDPFTVYRRLRRVTPSPYMFFMRLPGLALLGSSPEVLAGCANGKLRLCPIADAKPCGGGEEDNLFEEALVCDPQEQAEHITLVDLGKNDLSRIAVPGSVVLDRFMEVERFSHVMRLTSHIRADLAPGLDALDVLAATFPAGTVSGAPRIRAMELLAALEQEPRGPYAGAIGWLGLDKNGIHLDTGITVRSLWVRDNRVFWQTGSSVLLNSAPAEEWEKISRKAAAIHAVISGFQKESSLPANTAAPRMAAAAPAVSARETPHSLPQIIDTLARGEDLSSGMAQAAFNRLMDGEMTPAQAGAFLMGLRAKGETPEEMGAAVNAILERAVRVDAPRNMPVLDVVGTGGDGRSSFNCSSGAALVLASLGHHIIKHGNRSVSSRCGSADVLERLGFDLELNPEDIPARLEEDRFVFLFAPRFHPAFRHIMPVRRELGVRTLFNLLGPLVNPARPGLCFLGVPNPDILPLVANTLARMGDRSGAVVHGAGGYDELTTLGPAQVAYVRGGTVRYAELDPAEYGFPPCTQEDLAISGPEEGEAVLRALLDGQGPAPMRHMLALNAGFGLHLLLPDRTLTACVNEAQKAISSGLAGSWLRAVMQRRGFHRADRP